MLRINSARLGQQLQPAWRQSLFAIRHESTAAPSSTPATEDAASTEEKPKRLSERLGGTGRGKLLEPSGQNQDVFASFLAQAQKKQQRTRNNNNGGQRRSNQQREAKPGQFDDAKEDKSIKKRGDNTSRQRRPQQQASSSEGNNNNNNNIKRQGQQRSGRSGQQQQRERKPRQSSNSTSSAPVRRATTFINKDIDWVSLTPVEFTQQVVTDGETQQNQQQQQQQSVNTDDYAPFLSVGQSIQWPANVDTRGLETLISGNASYGLEAKTTFLATVAKASNAGGNATLKK
ncbi:hypothetical protein BC941DRAFT_443978 [Chlamydoabsidia padenii]|nr:hypothetical protein BC941DRAFT_443978 [Chlamydoabsidia padenii]